MSKKDKNLIPVEALEEGFEACRLLTELMLKSSEILLNSNQFSSSIALSILALEESTKLELIHKKIMTSQPINEGEWKKISGTQNSHLNKLVKPVKEEHDSNIELGKETYDQLKEMGKKLGIGSMPNFEEISSKNNAGWDYFRMLNSIKKDCLYLDWNNNHWFSFFYLPIEKQKAFATFRLYHTKRIIFNIILRNRVFHLTLNQNSNTQKKFEKEFEYYKKLMKDIEEKLNSKKFEKYVDETKDLLKEYTDLRLKKYVISSDDDELVFTLNDIHQLPDMFFELYLMTGIPPEQILTLKKQDIDLEKGRIPSNFDGCTICKKSRDPNSSIWLNHFFTNEHYGNARAYLKSKFHLKDDDPIFERIKNIISKMRTNAHTDQT